MAKGFTDIAIKNLKPGETRREIPDPGCAEWNASAPAMRWQRLRLRYVTSLNALKCYHRP